MDAILSPEQEDILKQTRDVLGDLREVLAQTTATAEERTALSDSIAQLDDLFLLVIAGEFNAGKSAFINALLGRDLQIEGVTPTTAQIYLLKYGEMEDQTPGNRGVWIQTAPVDILKKITIVDTPGTNAIHREHEALTSEFIPRSDLVLFITSADRPFTESERNFLTQIREWGKKIVLVINKVDILTEEEDVQKVIAFVSEAARNLVGEVSAIYPVSAKMAQKAKKGQPQLWEKSGFAPLEEYIQETLDDDGRFRLKLLNPLGVGSRLVSKQLDLAESDLASLAEDRQLLTDIEAQTTFYNEDMQRNFTARLGEINNELYEMEKRGNDFFDEMIRISRIPDLIRSSLFEKAFKERVVQDTPQRIEKRVNELIDWMVEQDLRQWTAVSDHLARRKIDAESRIIGQSGPKEGTLAYDRQRLIDSIGMASQKAVESFDREKEAMALADTAKSAVINTGLTGVAGATGVGLGILGAMQVVTFLDVTGIIAGLSLATIGALILPNRKRKAKRELEEKLNELRTKLVSSLTDQFQREMKRSAQRIEDTIAPFSRFVRSETEKYTKQQERLEEIEAHIHGLQAHLQVEAVRE